MGSAIQNILYQVSKDLPGADLDENSPPSFIDILDLALEDHWMENVVSKDLRALLRIGWVGFPGRI